MNNKDQMHPDDMRNLVIFCVLAILMYFGFESFILKPQKEAFIAAREAQVAAIATTPAEEVKILPRPEALAQSARVPIDNGVIFGSIALKGGRVDDIAFHEHYDTLEKKNNVVLLSPGNTDFSRFVDYGWVAQDNSVRVPGADTVWTVYGNDKLTKESPVTLSWDNGQGVRFERIFSIDDSYLFTVAQRVVNRRDEAITLYPYGLVTQTGLPPQFEGRYILHEGPVAYVGNELFEVNYKDMQKKPAQTAQGNQGWIGITDKYWLTSLLPAQKENVTYRFNYTPAKTVEGEGRYQVDFTGAPVTVKAGETIESASHLFTGVKRVVKLEQYEKQLGLPHFDLAVDFGMFYFLTKPFFYALHWLGLTVGNFGVAIICFTFIIRMAVFPLTNVSYRSFAKMKKVSPQILELRKAYGDDKMKLQQELVKLYEREGVNPLAGCLPILVQIPIFFALYKVLFATIEMRHAPFFGWIQDLSAPDPTSIFNLFGLLPYDVPGFLQIGVWPCLMLIVMIIQKRLNPPPQDPIQRDMMNYFPFVITYVLSHFASGLVIYWTVSAMLSVLQQMYIMRSLDVPIHLFGETKEEKEMEEAISHGPGVHPLAEMAEEKAEETLFGADDDSPAKEISPPKRKKKKKK